jgi:hypothetical protein
VELCVSLRHPAYVPGKQLRTANFDDDARVRLGDSVKAGRRAAGFRSRRAFADAAGIGKRSVDAVELYEPGVGEENLEAIGRTLGRYLEDWSKDTPRAILEDGLEPTNVPRQDDREVVQPQPAQAGKDSERYPDMEPALRSVIGLLRKQGVPEEAIMRAVSKIVDEYETDSPAAERDEPDTPRGEVG